MSKREIRQAAVCSVDIPGRFSPPPISRKVAPYAVAAILLATTWVLFTPGLSMAEDFAPVPNKMFGYLDPRTGNFIPAVPSARSAPTHDTAVSPIFRRGTLVVVETFSTPTTVPAKALFQNIVTASVSSQAGSATFSNSTGNSGVAQRKGGSGRIVVKVPYRFAVASASQAVTVSCLMTSPTGDEAMFTQTIPLPANNATTTLNITQRF